MFCLGIGSAIIIEAEKNEIHADGGRWRQPGVIQHVADNEQLAAGSQCCADIAQSEARLIWRQHLQQIAQDSHIVRTFRGRGENIRSP